LPPHDDCCMCRRLPPRGVAIPANSRTWRGIAPHRPGAAAARAARQARRRAHRGARRRAMHCSSALPPARVCVAAHAPVCHRARRTRSHRGPHTVRRPAHTGERSMVHGVQMRCLGQLHRHDDIGGCARPGRPPTWHSECCSSCHEVPQENLDHRRPDVGSGVGRRRLLRRAARPALRPPRLRVRLLLGWLPLPSRSPLVTGTIGG